MCSNKRFNEILEDSKTNLTEEIEKELKKTIQLGEKMSEENDKLFRSMLL